MIKMLGKFRWITMRSLEGVVDTALHGIHLKESNDKIHVHVIKKGNGKE